MNKFKVGDIVEVYDHCLTRWSRPYRVEKVLDPEDMNAIGYKPSGLSYSLKSLCSQYTRLSFVDMRTIQCPECDKDLSQDEIELMQALETDRFDWRCRGCS